MNITPGQTINVRFTIVNNGNMSMNIQGVAWVGGPGSGPGSPGVPGMANAVNVGNLNPNGGIPVTVPLTSPNDQSLYGKSFNIYIAPYRADTGELVGAVSVCDILGFPYPAASIASMTVTPRSIYPYSMDVWFTYKGPGGSITTNIWFVTPGGKPAALGGDWRTEVGFFSRVISLPVVGSYTWEEALVSVQSGFVGVYDYWVAVYQGTGSTVALLYNSPGYK